MQPAAMSTSFDLQGHRGARALKPENTLPSFEAAFDLGVHSIETDVHLTRDGVAVLYHDALVGDPPCYPLSAKGHWTAESGQRRADLVSCFTLAELREYRADRNPDPRRFPNQDAAVTPLAGLFAEQHSIDPYNIPTLEELLQFAAAYAGELGIKADKSDEQRRRVQAVRFDLELKRVPFHPETINDRFDGTRPGLLEERIVEAVGKAGVVARTTVRSFDHRCVRLLRRMEPGLTGAVLVAETMPMAPGELVERAEAQVYCPGYLFVDTALVRQVHAVGARVLPWTVNQPEHWQRLLDWDVDGITTDVPDRLAAYLREQGIAF
ncbi:MAG TPA: glycerophosphodiester phosphodiesterase family protein [Gemmataceae bacterium]|jgi:glycerophosphoryl diester phosphodiesterase